MSAFWGTDCFKGMTLGEQNKIRANTWEAAVDGKEAGRLTDLPDQAEDATAFRLWIETQDDGPAIEFTFGVLKRSKSWEAMPGPSQASISAAVTAKVGG